MKTKEINKKYLLIGIFTIIILISFAIICKVSFSSNKSYAKETSTNSSSEIQDNNLSETNNISNNSLETNDFNSENPSDENNSKISNANITNVDEIINKNKGEDQYEKITKKEEVLEYLTQYRINKEIPNGISYVVQEGRQGKQEIITKTIYDKDGNVKSVEQTDAKITKAALDKIVEVGGASYSAKNKVKAGDTIYVTSDTLSMWADASEESRKITTLKENENLKVLEVISNWYKISYNNDIGWVKAECTLNTNLKNSSDSASKAELIKALNFNMNLNKPSGLSLEQFKKILSDDNDKNKIFENNAEYFYYIENQYNINGVFVAALGIHESNWGTSTIALQKNNLFGYGAYDSNPYNGAYYFTKYSECIDLIARVLVKYYLNPKGTSIYGGETAISTFYNGSTLTGVNTNYATDKNWANAVYNQMQYLYNKL